ncbi:MAG: phage portal protein [Chloroflexia bacterium]|nr:phage portal protein [Chloroflexia bacterium]
MSALSPLPREAISTAWSHGLLGPEDEARFGRYRRALAFYGGEQWSERAASASRRGETRLVVNYARTLVRKVASYVFPAPVRFSVPPEPDEPAVRDAANRAERLLAALGSELDLGRLDLALCIDAAVLGDAAVKVTWDAVRGQPRVVAVDPATLSARWAPDDPRDLRRMVQVYGLTGEGIADLFPDVPRSTGPLGLDAGRGYAVVEEWTAERWRLSVAGQLVHDRPNPYGWIPYVVVANDPRPFSFWGQSDLDDLEDVCRELNRRLTTLARVLELSGAPIAVLENVDGSEGISVGPGAKWELPEGARAYLLDLLGGGGVGLHIDYVNLLYRSLHDLSETPRTAFGDAGRDLSGAALEVEIQPLVQKVGRKRRLWDGFYTRRNALLLDLLERFGGEELAGLRRTATIWPSVLPSDTDGAVRNAVALVGGGIQSRRTAIAALGGDDPEAELARIVAEQAAFGGSDTAEGSSPAVTQAI